MTTKKPPQMTLADVDALPWPEGTKRLITDAELEEERRATPHGLGVELNFGPMRYLVSFGNASLRDILTRLTALINDTERCAPLLDDARDRDDGGIRLLSFGTCRTCAFRMRQLRAMGESVSFADLEEIVLRLPGIARIADDPLECDPRDSLPPVLYDLPKCSHEQMHIIQLSMLLAQTMMDHKVEQASAIMSDIRDMLEFSGSDDILDWIVQLQEAHDAMCKLDERKDIARTGFTPVRDAMRDPRAN